VSGIELLRYFFSSSYFKKASHFIKEIKKEGDYILVFLKSCKDPLYIPADINEQSLKQVIVECFYTDNWHFYEIPQTKVLKNDTVVDCGAAEGLFAMLIKDRCNMVYLIEPLTKFVNALEKTFQNVDNTAILPCAISNREFHSKMLSSDISSSLSDNGEGEAVQVTTLDKLFFEKGIAVNYLKLDLEGHDFEALLGAEQLIRKNKPKIAVTTYHKKEHAAQIEAFLTQLNLGYKILKKGIYQETGSPVMLHAWV
jgi:FkbM family methyltransferase